MAKRVFISRDLASDSPFRELLSAAGFEVIGKYLIEFSAVGFSDPPLADWVFCYSSRAVDFFIAGLRKLGLDPERYPHYAALGSGTAASLQKRGITPDFTGTGAPAATATAFLECARGRRVLFPRAEQSRQSIQRLLKGELDMIDLIVYRNQKLHHPDVPRTTYAVLTSPLNAQAYCSGQTDRRDRRIVAIGTTTANALQQLGILTFRTAQEPTEEALARAVLEWEKSTE